MFRVASLFIFMILLISGLTGQAKSRATLTCESLFPFNPVSDFLEQVPGKNKLVPMRKEYRNEDTRSYVTAKEYRKLVVVIKEGRLFSEYYNEFIDTGWYYPSSASRAVEYNYVDFVIDENGNLLLSLYLERPYGQLQGHSVLGRGKNVLAAGRMQIQDGQIISINNHSGHYGHSFNQLKLGVRYLRFLGAKIRSDNVFDYSGVLR